MVRHVDISSLLIRSKHCENESGDYIYPGRLYVSYHEVYTVPGLNYETCVSFPQEVKTYLPFRNYPICCAFSSFHLQSNCYFRLRLC